MQGGASHDQQLQQSESSQQSVDSNDSEFRALEPGRAPYPEWLDRFGVFLLSHFPQPSHRLSIWQLMLRLGSGLGLMHPRSSEAPGFAASAYFTAEMDGGAIFRRFKQWLVQHGLEVSLRWYLLRALRQLINKTFVADRQGYMRPTNAFIGLLRWQ